MAKVNPCLAREAVAVASGGTYAGAALTAPAAPPAYSCPVGVSSNDCSYLTDLANSFGAASIPGNAPAAARNPWCPELKTMSVDAVAKLWPPNHQTFTSGQAEQFIEITQKDMCGG